MGHIKRVIDAKNSQKTHHYKSRVATKNMDAEVLQAVWLQLTKLQIRLKSRFKSVPEKIITCLLCCSVGGCCDLTKAKRQRNHRRAAAKSKRYQVGVVAPEKDK